MKKAEINILVERQHSCHDHRLFEKDLWVLLEAPSRTPRQIHFLYVYCSVEYHSQDTVMGLFERFPSYGTAYPMLQLLALLYFGGRCTSETKLKKQSQEKRLFEQRIKYCNSQRSNRIPKLNHKENACLKALEFRLNRCKRS